MKNINEEWKGKQGIHEKHSVNPPKKEETEPDIKKRVEIFIREAQRADVIEILGKYNSLLKEEEPDYDLWEMLPQLTDKFLQKYYPKI
jgi:hypothetical protein